MKSRKDFTVFEYGHLISDKDSGRINNAVSLPLQLFEWLEQRCLKDDADNTHRLLTLGSRGGVKTLQVKNYAGVISLPGNAFIEVLPKTGRRDDNIDIARQQLLMMLRTLKSFRHIATSASRVRTSKMPLMDVFIQQFVDSVQQIVRQGLKRDYLHQQDNLPWMKGKLRVSAQLSKNCVRRDRFQVEFDDYSAERLENRILKTAIDKIRRQISNPQLLLQVNSLQVHFEDIAPVGDARIAFDQVHLDRHMRHYELALAWARLILMGQSPHCMQGDANAISLLFPMEAVFESFVTAWMRHRYDDNWHVEAQVDSHTLVRLNGNGLFKLRPDIHLRPRGENWEQTMICDVKWKMVDSGKATLEQSQADLYQMLAYGVNYQEGIGDMLLIYPSHEGFSQPLPHPYEFNHQKDNPLRLWVVPFFIGESLQSSGLRFPDGKTLI
ncbi:McrC family protein [Serratia marcescens]|uniref:McrC family protein n=1 Tax=Serratia TaxID=613 RepID=UPI000B5DEB8F|nr:MULTISPECIES: McrC family protein [Serratia]ASM24340.1 restriction endonuclease [Serratia marcescens]ASM29117.1 restriction endonuclease [Serratia marcescens]MBN5418081.1 McrC family protein [Serratia marcescens]UKG75220.1 McrC family protein [Serratia marcescens]